MNWPGARPRPGARPPPAVQRRGGDGAGDTRGAHQVGDREAAGDRADLEHRTGVVAEPLDAPAHDVAHPRGNQGRARRRVVGGPRPTSAAPARPRRTGCPGCAGARPRRWGAPPRRAAARARRPARARRARSAPPASRPRSRSWPPGTRPRPPCRRRPAARARPARRGRRGPAAAARTRRPGAGRRARSTAGESAAAGGEQVHHGVVEPQPLLLAAGPGRAQQWGRAPGPASPETRLLSDRTTGRQTPYGSPSASPRPAHRDAAAGGRRRGPARRAASSCRCRFSPASTTVRAEPPQPRVSALRRRSSSGPRPTTPAGASSSSLGRAISRSSSRATVAASFGRSAGSGGDQGEDQPVQRLGDARHAARRRLRRAHPEQVLGVERPHAAQAARRASRRGRRGPNSGVAASPSVCSGAA